jgi:alpha-galactosidase
MSAHRVWRYFVDDKDEYGQGEISLWTGPLSEGDQVVALLNGGNNSRTMNASLAQIFADFGGGSAKQIQYKWDVYDLWANRMDNEVASQIVDTSSKDLQVQALTSQHLFNVTETSYAEGLALNDPRLLGKKTGTVEAGGTIYAEVPRHGVALYRLRKTQEKSAAGTKQDL